MALKPSPGNYPKGAKDPAYLAAVKDMEENPSKWGGSVIPRLKTVVVSAPGAEKPATKKEITDALNEAEVKHEEAITALKAEHEKTVADLSAKHAEAIATKDAELEAKQTLKSKSEETPK